MFFLFSEKAPFQKIPFSEPEVGHLLTRHLYRDDVRGGNVHHPWRVMTRCCGRTCMVTVLLRIILKVLPKVSFKTLVTGGEKLLFQPLGCRKWGCNKWGLKGCVAALLGNQPKSAFLALFLPFSPFSGGCEEHLMSSDLLKPPSLKPPFAALQNQATCGGSGLSLVPPDLS